MRRRGVERPAHREQREGAGVAEAARADEARRSFRHETELDERRGEARGAAGDHVVAVQQHGGADTDCEAGHGRDQGLLRTRERMEKAHDRRCEAFGVLHHRQEIGEIVAGAEGARRARDDDAAQRRRLVGAFERG